MKRLGIPVVISLFAFACGGSSSSPSAAPAPSPVVPTTTTGNTVFTVALGTNGEIPAISGSETTASGVATITLHTTKDASGNVTAANADFSVTASGFPSGSQLTAAHIHTGAAGTAGAVLVDTGLSAGAVTLSGGSGSFTKTGINVDANLATSIIKSPGAYYFNVHTAANPNGVARGQLDNSGAGATPPPSTPPPGSGYGAPAR